MFSSIDSSDDTVVEHSVLQYQSVQHSLQISKQEQNYVNERSKLTKQALQKILPKGTNVKYVLFI
jgi:hypothetical protein